MAPEDFSLAQLEQANRRLRLDCFYKVETKQQTAERYRSIRGAAGDAGTRNEEEEPVLSNDEAKRIRKKERDNLFLCFRKFFEDNQNTLFSLQNLDYMLYQETAPCEDRLVNRKCATKQPYKKHLEELKLDGGDLPKRADFGDMGSIAKKVLKNSAVDNRKIGKFLCCKMKDGTGLQFLKPKPPKLNECPLGEKKPKKKTKCLRQIAAKKAAKARAAKEKTEKAGVCCIKEGTEAPPKLVDSCDGGGDQKKPGECSTETAQPQVCCIKDGTEAPPKLVDSCDADGDQKKPGECSTETAQP